MDEPCDESGGWSVQEWKASTIASPRTPPGGTRIPRDYVNAGGSSLKGAVTEIGETRLMWRKRRTTGGTLPSLSTMQACGPARCSALAVDRAVCTALEYSVFSIFVPPGLPAQREATNAI